MKNNFFGNVQFVPGVGFIEQRLRGDDDGRASLGDESAVMMISGVPSGLGSQAVVDDKGQPANPLTGKSLAVENFFSKKVSVFGIEAPMWLWILLAAGIIGAGYFFFYRNKK